MYSRRHGVIINYVCDRYDESGEIQMVQSITLIVAVYIN